MHILTKFQTFMLESGIAYNYFKVIKLMYMINLATVAFENKIAIK